MKFDDITVGMVYPMQAGNCGLLSLSNWGFLKDIITERYNANNEMIHLEVISIIWKNGTM